jgi:hypothetical protein
VTELGLRFPVVIRKIKRPKKPNWRPLFWCLFGIGNLTWCVFDHLYIAQAFWCLQIWTKGREVYGPPLPFREQLLVVSILFALLITSIISQL